MRRALIAFGTLGGGTVIAFILAGLAFLADPNGRLVPVSAWPMPALQRGPVPEPAILIDPAVPQPAPGVVDAVVGIGAAPAAVEIDRPAEEELAPDAGG